MTENHEQYMYQPIAELLDAIHPHRGMSEMNETDSIDQAVMCIYSLAAMDCKSWRSESFEPKRWKPKSCLVLLCRL